MIKREQTFPWKDLSNFFILINSSHQMFYLLFLLLFCGYVNLSLLNYFSFSFSSVAQSCPTLCDPMNRSTPGLPVHHQLSEFTITHVHRVSDAIQPSHPLLSPFPSAPSSSQHQSLFQWVTWDPIQASKGSQFWGKKKIRSKNPFRKTIKLLKIFNLNI